MEEKIYIKLLGEGTTVYRPVNAMKIDKKIFKISSNMVYDSDDEVWEFLPGSTVLVKELTLEGERVLVAIKHTKE